MLFRSRERAFCDTRKSEHLLYVSVILFFVHDMIIRIFETLYRKAVELKNFPELETSRDESSSAAKKTHRSKFVGERDDDRTDDHGDYDSRNLLFRLEHFFVRLGYDAPVSMEQCQVLLELLVRCRRTYEM